MQVKLHLVKGNPQGKQVEVPPGALTIGRAEDSDLIIASTRVSRHHCELINEDKRVLIRDKKSGNGTLVNGEKIEEAVLSPGDEIQVGPLTFAIEIDGKRQRVAATAKPVAQAKPLAHAAPAAKAGPSLKAAPKPAAKPAPQGPVVGGGKRSPNDILASLERMAGGKKPGDKPPAAGSKKSDNVIEISDEDLLDTDK